ncbi:MAG: DUF2085 domain-containing protein [Anaerolineaceae bacterium]
MQIKGNPLTKSRIGKTLLILTSLTITILWLNYAPSGLLGKMDAIGYAVCHRIDLRSFHLGERALPLCSRCSGMHLATLLGLVFQLQFGKKIKMPPKWILIVLGFLAAAFALDGLNSYLHFFPNSIWIYEPHNWLRLLTGSGLGLGISLVLYPIINQTLWNNWEDGAAVSKWKTFVLLLSLTALLDLAILSENPIVLYPLAILSGLAVLFVLTLCYSLLISMLTKKENSYSSWKAAWIPILAGFTIAVFQTYVVDILRFSITQTWGGFIF